MEGSTEVQISRVSGGGSAFAADGGKKPKRTGKKTDDVAKKELKDGGKKKGWGLKIGVPVAVIGGGALLVGAVFLGTLIAAKRFGWNLPGPLNTLKMKMPG